MESTTVVNSYEKMLEVLELWMDEFEVKECDTCGRLMIEGYCIESGMSYYCTDECLEKDMTKEEFENLYDDGDGDSYWTQWETCSPEMFNKISELHDKIKNGETKLYDQDVIVLNDLNPDYELRDSIIGIDTSDRNTSCVGFTGLSIEKLELLLAYNFINRDECQNNSPSTEEFFNFMKKYPSMTAHGYAVGNGRDDYRVTLEGIQTAYRPSYEMLIDFVEKFRYADVFEANKNTLYCWWD